MFFVLFACSWPNCSLTREREEQVGKNELLTRGQKQSLSLGFIVPCELEPLSAIESIVYCLWSFPVLPWGIIIAEGRLCSDFLFFVCQTELPGFRLNNVVRINTYMPLYFRVCNLVFKRLSHFNLKREPSLLINW